MDKGVVSQKISVKTDGAFDKALKYYTVLLSLNNIYLPEMQLNLLAFMAVKGSISSGGAKEKFIEMFPSTSKASIGNFIDKLKKRDLVIKVDKKIVVNPSIALDFTIPLILQIKLNGETS